MEQTQETQNVGVSQNNFSEYNTRIRDIEERNNVIKERTLVLSRNFVDFKNETNEDLREIKKILKQLSEDNEKIKSTLNSLIQQNGKYVKRDEMVGFERMLKDFQPLEFVRMKDLDELVEKKTKTKRIKKENS
jgi:tetrahydromethanopterin S-methyltransferase subunit G